MNYAKSALSYFTLKRCYKYLLKRLFGSFIVHEDINLDQLDVDLYKGQVKLENIHIQAEKINSILSSLNVPLVMVKGTINRIHLSVPWKHVFSQRCKVYFEGVDLHFAMRNEVAMDRSGLSQGEMDGPVRPGGPDGHATRSYMEAVEESHVPDGVEALTRLVQHILVNLEVCLADATVTLHPGGWDPSVSTGQPKIWATMKELLIYSDTETHRLPDASPKPAESEEFSEELPASPIDSKGMSLLSVEVFVARDDDTSRLLHT
ncbi:Autophagy- protein 2 A, partial [Perkinsus olseni]